MKIFISFITPNSKIIIVTLRIATIGKSELTFLLIFQFPVPDVIYVFLLEAFLKHAPLKKKVFRRNHAPYVHKFSKKSIYNRGRPKSEESLTAESQLQSWQKLMGKSIKNPSPIFNVVFRGVFVVFK